MTDHPVICGMCDGEFTMKYSIEERDGCTTNCPLCDGLILFLEDGSSMSLHEHIHDASEGAWPKDGVGTGSVSMRVNLMPMSDEDVCCTNPDPDLPENFVELRIPSVMCRNCDQEIFLQWDLAEQWHSDTPPDRRTIEERVAAIKEKQKDRDFNDLMKRLFEAQGILDALKEHDESDDDCDEWFQP